MKKHFISILFLFSCLFQVTSGYSDVLNIYTTSELIDQPLQITVTELVPHEIIKLKATSYDCNSTPWESWAEFKADEFGIVDVGRQIPLDGTYHIKDDMGLFWSMKPSVENHKFFSTKENTVDIAIALVKNKKTVASLFIQRLKKLPGVKRIPIKKDGIVGILFLPEKVKKPSVIITLNGSQGTINENIAQLLASHGFAVLGLGYFGMDGLPQKLENIPMEYFQNAIRWIQSRSDLNGSKIGLYGISRGAELALILGSLFPESIKAIVGTLPSSVINPGLGNINPNAWIYQGIPVGPAAMMEPFELQSNLGQNASNPIVMVTSFLEGMQNYPSEFAAAAIPVEKIECPLLLISAGDDKMWPSWIYAERIKNRLEEYHSDISCTILNYPKAGHLIGIPYLPARATTYCNPKGYWFSMGGNAEENELASQDSWKKIIDFFDNALNEPSKTSLN